MVSGFDRSFRFGSAEETSSVARALSPDLCPGDAILLEGGLGAGKTHFARALIQARLAGAGFHEEVPSPTYTLVQTYSDGEIELLHVDLYRLSGPDAIAELGLDEAFANAVCMIEWPDRLGDMMPNDALTLRLEMTDIPGERLVRVTSSCAKWVSRFLRIGLETVDG